MRILMDLSGGYELDDCDCAVVEIDAAYVERLTGMAQQLFRVHADQPEVYKIDFWNNPMEVYSYKLTEALEGVLMSTHAQCHGGQHSIIPDDFEIPADCEPQRLECRLTQVVQPHDWTDRDSVDLQFSAVIKHTTVTLHTYQINLGALRSRFSD